MFEFQTAISRADRDAGLERLPVRGALLGRGGRLPREARDRAARRFVVSRGLHPHSRETLETYSAGYGTEVVEVPLADGVTDAGALAAAVDDDTAAVFLQYPNFLGAIEDLEALAPVAKRTGALLVVSVDAPTLGVLRPPGDLGADVVVGEGQPLGNRLDFGGPSFGFFAAREEYIRRMPGPDRGRDAPTSTAAAASCSRSRRASSTSAARRRPRTSARARRSTRSRASST